LYANKGEPEMDVIIHQKATEIALSKLLGWQKKAITKDVKTALKKWYCVYPDAKLVYNAGEIHDTAVLLRKHISDSEPDPYFFQCHAHPDIYSSPEALEKVIIFYINNMIRCLKKNRISEFAKYCGCYSHYVIDASSPAHIRVSEEHIQTMLPGPKKNPYKLFNHHWIIEGIPMKIENIGDYETKCLGESAEEIIFFSMERFLRLINNAQAARISLIQTLYRNNKKRANQIKQAVIKQGIELLADTMHSVFNVSFRKSDERGKSKAMFLSDLVYFSYFSPTYSNGIYSNKVFSDRSLARVTELGWETTPLKLFAIENGRKKKWSFKKGLGMGVPTKVQYDLGKNIFSSFSCFVGMHADLGKQGLAIFRIHGDGKELYNSGVVKGNESLREVDISIRSIKKLVVETEAVKRRDGLSGWGTKDHAVWADAKLWK